jgi:hypothetical protein
VAELDTVQDYVTKSRTMLQDLISPYRFSDDELVGNLNAAILDTRRIRPDLFYQYMTTPYSKTDLPFFVSSSMSDMVDFEPMYRMALVYHMVGYTQLQNNENVDDQRGMAFMQRWTQILGGVTA